MERLQDPTQLFGKNVTRLVFASAQVTAPESLKAPISPELPSDEIVIPMAPLGDSYTPAVAIPFTVQEAVLYGTLALVGTASLHLLRPFLLAKTPMEFMGPLPPSAVGVVKDGIAMSDNKSIESKIDNAPPTELFFHGSDKVPNPPTNSQRNSWHKQEQLNIWSLECLLNWKPLTMAPEWEVSFYPHSQTSRKQSLAKHMEECTLTPSYRQERYP